MTRKYKTMIAAGILAACATMFFAAATFTTASAKTTDPIAALTEILEFKLERLATVMDAMQTAMDAMLTAMQTAMETMIAAMVPLMEQGIDAMLKLSDDILLMAGEIGKMADRIVETMQLMSDTLLQMQKTFALMLVALQDGNNATVAGVAAGVVGEATLILSPSEGQALTDGTVFELAGGHDDFILYASSDPGMATSMNILVEDNMLAAAVARIKGYVSKNKIYVAAKAVDGGAVSDLSNTVMLYVQ